MFSIGMIVKDKNSHTLMVVTSIGHDHLICTHYKNRRRIIKTYHPKDIIIIDSGETYRCYT